jgi:hypothetical protein
MTPLEKPKITSCVLQELFRPERRLPIGPTRSRFCPRAEPPKIEALVPCRPGAILLSPCVSLPGRGETSVTAVIAGPGRTTGPPPAGKLCPADLTRPDSWAILRLLDRESSRRGGRPRSDQKPRFSTLRRLNGRFLENPTIQHSLENPP